MKLAKLKIRQIVIWVCTNLKVKALLSVKKNFVTKLGFRETWLAESEYLFLGLVISKQIVSVLSFSRVDIPLTVTSCAKRIFFSPY